MNKKFGNTQKNNSLASWGRRKTTHPPPTHTHALVGEPVLTNSGPWNVGRTPMHPSGPTAPRVGLWEGSMQHTSKREYGLVANSNIMLKPIFFNQTSVWTTDCCQSSAFFSDARHLQKCKTRLLHSLLFWKNIVFFLSISHT